MGEEQDLDVGSDATRDCCQATQQACGRRKRVSLSAPVAHVPPAARPRGAREESVSVASSESPAQRSMAAAYTPEVTVWAGSQQNIKAKGEIKGTRPFK